MGRPVLRIYDSWLCRYWLGIKFLLACGRELESIDKAERPTQTFNLMRHSRGILVIPNFINDFMHRQKKSTFTLPNTTCQCELSTKVGAVTHIDDGP